MKAPNFLGAAALAVAGALASCKQEPPTEADITTPPMIWGDCTPDAKSARFILGDKDTPEGPRLMVLCPGHLQLDSCTAETREQIITILQGKLEIEHPTPNCVRIRQH